MIQTLIDRPDNFEVVRDRIAEILAAETASQQALAFAAGKDPELWRFRVFTERSNPWEPYLATPVQDSAPIVNVWFESESFDTSKGNTVSKQQAQGVFNIDIIALGQSAPDGVGGQVLGDQEAAANLQRTARLVRSIMMASEYTYLKYRGVVGFRWPESITTYQPQLGATPAIKVLGARVVMSVHFNEFAPQFIGEELETIDIEVKRAEDDEVIAVAQYNYPLT